MKPDPKFLRQTKDFWANVRLVSEKFGYTERGQKRIKVPGVGDLVTTLGALQLDSSHLVKKNGQPTKTGRMILDYFQLRADRLNQEVQANLMDAAEAKKLFNGLKAKHKPTCPLPMNKQKGDKKAPAYLTGIVNMLIEAHAGGNRCDYDPRRLTTFTRAGSPFRTLARRVDGCFPTTVNPVAMWEIKEYYYTTTFGSRVADGVYETLLDGMELEEARQTGGLNVRHYLIIDSHFTWWECGRSYLCRIFDMLHMGYVDEVLFGREVAERLPALVREWGKVLQARTPAS